VLVLVVVLALLGLIRTTSNQIGLLADVRWQPNKYVRICEVRLCDPDGVSADDADSVQACADSIAQRAEDERRLSIVISAYFYNPTRLALSLTTLEFSLIAGLAEVAAHHPASTIADLPYLGIAPENLPLDSWADSEWHEVVACRKSEGDLIVAAETTTLITLACNVASDDLAATLTSLLASTTQTPLLLHDAIAGSALGGLLPVETGIHTPLYAGYTLPSLPELTASAGRRLSEWMPHELTNGTGEAAPPEAAPSAEAAAEPVDVPHPSSPKPADKPENWEAASDATELLSSEVGCVGYDEVTALIPPTQAAISFCGADASALQQTLTQAATECVVSLANDAVENLAEHAHDRASQMAEHASEIALSGNPRDALANLAGQGVGGGIGGRLQGGEATGPGLMNGDPGECFDTFIAGTEKVIVTATGVVYNPTWWPIIITASTALNIDVHLPVAATDIPLVANLLDDAMIEPRTATPITFALDAKAVLLSPVMVSSAARHELTCAMMPTSGCDYPQPILLRLHATAEVLVLGMQIRAQTPVISVPLSELLTSECGTPHYGCCRAQGDGSVGSDHLSLDVIEQSLSQGGNVGILLDDLPI